MKPDFIGIGAQKCATAWLYNMLADHPHITMAAPRDGDKDTKFFSYFYDRGFEWYERHFQKQEGGITGEYSTSYFYSLEAPERIFNYAPEIKLIVSFRHPVERAFSNHKHEIKLGRISGENLVFENALKNNPMYLYQSLYYTHLTRWLRYFNKKQIFIIIVDDLKTNPEKTIRSLYTFLGVDHEYKPAMLHQKIHESRISRSTMLESSIKKCSTFLKSMGGNGLVNYLKSKGINKAVYQLISKNETAAFLSMQEKTRAYLLEYFSEEITNLSELIDRDLSAWRG